MALLSNVELILRRWLGEDVTINKPQSRVEVLLIRLMGLQEEIEDEIKTLSKLTKWLGETTTPLYDGSTANPIVISGVSITATEGNVAKYQNDHFIFSEADTWQPYNDTLDVYTKDESDARYEPKTVTLTQAQYDALTPAEKNNGIIYFISDGGSSGSGGGGGARTLTTLYTNEFNAFAAGSTITLSDDVDKYDEIYIYSAYNELGDGNYLCHVGRGTLDKEQALWSLSETQLSGNYRGWVDVLCSVASGSYLMSWAIKITNKTTLVSAAKNTGGWSASQCGITKIVGVKYGGGQ